MTDSGQTLFDLDNDDDYVEVLYRVLLERPADPGGLDFYRTELSRGHLQRRDVFYQLLTSEEGRARGRYKYPYELIMENFVEPFSNHEFLPFVSSYPFEGPQLCECGNPRKWLLEDWRTVLDSLGLSSSPALMHRKGFEWAQTLFGLRLLGQINDEARYLGVGSGHEAILYWLANHVGEVVASDLYEGEWSTIGALEGDPGVLLDAAKYAPFQYREDRLSFLKMDGRELDFDDDSFDVVFSLGSIEHFGGNAAAARAMREQARVCRPGGIVVMATELILNDRQHPEFFTIDELREHIVVASGLELIQPPEFRIPSYALHHPCVMPEETHRAPHLILDFDGVITTSVIFFFRSR